MSIYLFAVEGPDGVGKTTLLQQLTQYFQTNTKYHVKQLNPCNNDLGKAVKALINDIPNLPRNAEIKVHQATLAYVYEKEIVPMIDKYHNNDKQHLIVFIDRWYWSTSVYQHFSNIGVDNQERMVKCYLDKRDGMAHLQLAFDPYAFNPTVVPVIPLFLDADDTILDKRLYENRKLSTLEKYEAKDKQQRVRHAYRCLANLLPNAIKVDVSNDDVDTNVKSVLSQIIKRL